MSLFEFDYQDQSDPRLFSDHIGGREDRWVVSGYYSPSDGNSDVISSWLVGLDANGEPEVLDQIVIQEDLANSFRFFEGMRTQPIGNKVLLIFGNSGDLYFAAVSYSTDDTLNINGHKGIISHEHIGTAINALDANDISNANFPWAPTWQITTAEDESGNVLILAQDYESEDGFYAVVITMSLGYPEITIIDQDPFMTMLEASGHDSQVTAGHYSMACGLRHIENNRWLVAVHPDVAGELLPNTQFLIYYIIDIGGNTLSVIGWHEETIPGVYPYVNADMTDDINIHWARFTSLLVNSLFKVGDNFLHLIPSETMTKDEPGVPGKRIGDIYHNQIKISVAGTNINVTESKVFYDNKGKSSYEHNLIAPSAAYTRGAMLADGQGVLFGIHRGYLAFNSQREVSTPFKRFPATTNDPDIKKEQYNMANIIFPEKVLGRKVLVVDRGVFYHDPQGDVEKYPSRMFCLTLKENLGEASDFPSDEFENIMTSFPQTKEITLGPWVTLDEDPEDGFYRRGQIWASCVDATHALYVAYEVSSGWELGILERSDKTLTRMMSKVINPSFRELRSVVLTRISDEYFILSGRGGGFPERLYLFIVRVDSSYNITVGAQHVPPESHYERSFLWVVRTGTDEGVLQYATPDQGSAIYSPFRRNGMNIDFGLSTITDNEQLFGELKPYSGGRFIAAQELFDVALDTYYIKIEIWNNDFADGPSLETVKKAYMEEGKLQYFNFEIFERTTDALQIASVRYEDEHDAFTSGGHRYASGLQNSEMFNIKETTYDVNSESFTSVSDSSRSEWAFIYFPRRWITHPPDWNEFYFDDGDIGGMQNLRISIDGAIIQNVSPNLAHDQVLASHPNRRIFRLYWDRRPIEGRKNIFDHAMSAADFQGDLYLAETGTETFYRLIAETSSPGVEHYYAAFGSGSPVFFDESYFLVPGALFRYNPGDYPLTEDGFIPDGWRQEWADSARPFQVHAFAVGQLTD